MVYKTTLKALRYARKNSEKRKSYAKDWYKRQKEEDPTFMFRRRKASRDYYYKKIKEDGQVFKNKKSRVSKKSYHKRKNERKGMV